MLGSLSQPSSLSMPSMMDTDDDEDAQGFDEAFDPQPPEAYECPVCLLVINKPVQTVCGHRFCRSCIMRVLREGRRNCPIDNEELDENMIFPDNFARREISMLTVHCRNQKEYGCTWLGPLKELPKHMNTCQFSLVDCPNTCGTKLSRNEVNHHIEAVCSRRIVSCPHCQIKVVAGKLEEHIDRCQRFPVSCPNACSDQVIPREELDRHIESECPKAVVACTYKELGCIFEGTRESLRTHMDQNAGQHLEKAMNMVKNMSFSLERQQFEYNKMKEEMAALSKQIKSGSQFHSPGSSSSATVPMSMPMPINNSNNPDLGHKYTELRELISRIDKKADQNKMTSEMVRNEIRTARTELETQINEVKNSVKEQAELLTEVTARVWCGKFIWRISGFEKLFNQSKSGDVPAIHSLPFYTGIPGYKMCLRVNLNGIDSGVGTHVSMFVHLMMGEFDSIIDWPFPGTITLTVMDQIAENPEHIRETLAARSSLQAFLRPKTNRNHKGYGYVEMVPHQTLRTRNYIREDTMVVRVDFRMPDQSR